ncbi:MAG: hypothetical protein WAN11_26880 [Syntrophobacteraceae bacterium]
MYYNIICYTDLSPEARATCVGQYVIECDKHGKNCTGSYFNTCTFIAPVPPANSTAAVPPTDFSISYSAGTMEEVSCHE